MKKLLLLVVFGIATLATKESAAQTPLPRAGWVATASSSSGSDTPSHAIDGNSTTRWSTGSDQTAGQWFSIDMQTPQSFSQITIDPAGSTSDFTQAFQIFVSNDAVDWGVPVASGTGTSGVLTIIFPTQTARFVGVVQTGTGTHWWSIAEINVYGPGATPTGPLSTIGWVASASVSSSTDVPSRAIDGNLGTRWSTGTGQANGQNFQVDMLQQQSVSGVVMNSDGSTNDYARGYQIYVSNDTSNWGAAVATGTATSSPISVTFAKKSGRYLKIVQTGSASNWWSIAELTVIGDIPFVPTAMVLPRSGWTATASPSCTTDTASKAIDDDISTRFSTCQTQTNGQYFQVDMGGPLSFTKITLDAGSSTGDYPRGYAVYATNDTSNWGDPVATGVGSSQLVTINFSYQNARYIKVVQTGTSASNWWSIHEFNVYGIPPYLLMRDGWVASASLNGSLASSAIDGKLGTRWDTGTPQANQQWFQLDMLSPQTFNQITLNSDGNTSDYPRGYQVFVSNNPSSFGNPVATGTGSAAMVSIGFPAQTGRYIRVVQTGSASNWWSIAEVNVYGVCGGSGTAVCLRLDGVVDMGNGKFVAVFGHDSAAPTSIRPTQNEVRMNGVLVTNPQPAPPIQFPPGSHPGSFLPNFNVSQTISWTVDGQMITASASLTHLQTVPIGTSGIGVQIGGSIITIQPDLAPYSQAPPNPTPQTPPTPGSEFFGTLKGNLSVSSTGAATYAVPITIPPGVSGIAPNLSLVYTSQGGDGLAGQGWELAGLSMIHRCPQNRIEDGFTRPMHVNDDDAICIDGKRLFRGTTTGSDTTFTLESTDFSTITQSSVDQSFTVVTKTGEIRHYGSSGATQMALPNPAAPLTSVIVMWALDRVEDAWGNYFLLQYNRSGESFATEGLRVTQIDYTGHNAIAPICDDISGTCTGGQAEILPFQHIKLHYEMVQGSGVDEARPDIRHVRFGQWSIPKKYRLSAIDTGLGTYSLTYLDPDLMMPSRLRRIDYCASAAAAPGIQVPPCLQGLEFDWDGGGYSWVQEPTLDTTPQQSTYQIPVSLNRIAVAGTGTLGSGVQFIDLDSDGRLDIVFALAGTPRTAWWNNGHGWTERPDWALPHDLVQSNGASAGSLLTDVDGDGAQDLVFADGSQHGPQVYLNQIRTGGSWAAATQYSVLPSTWTGANANLKTTDTMADMDGDGHADFVRFGPGDYDIQVLLSGPTGWTVPTVSYESPSILNVAPGFHLEDLNRDGLTDLVSNDGKFSYINTGPRIAGYSVWGNSDVSTAPNATFPPGTRYFGDIDGDGLQEPIQYTPPTVSTTVNIGPPRTCTVNLSATQIHDPRIVFATGTGYFGDGTQAFRDAVNGYMPKGSDVTDPNDCDKANAVAAALFNLADLNGDGLTDFIVGHQDGGQFLVNTGTTWVDSQGRGFGWTVSAGTNPLPVVPGEATFNGQGASFIDLDGDGIDDLVQGFTTFSPFNTVRKAWRNTFRPPIITGFPNGLAPKSQVDYVVVTTDEAKTRGVYSDPNPVETGTRVMMAPMRVVETVRSEDGSGDGTLGLTTSYKYESLRASTSGRGPQGFRKMIVSDNASLMTTTTTFAQAFPYTGMPITIERHWTNGFTTKPQSLITNEYCDSTAIVANSLQCTPITGTTTLDPPGTSRFVYPTQKTEVAYLVGDTGTDTITTTSSYLYDDSGNPTTIEIDAQSSDGEHIETFTTNEYGDPGSLERKEGKVTKTVVETQRLAPLDGNNTPISHTTTFEYASFGTPSFTSAGVLALGLKQKIIEPGSGAPIELHTVYAYDAFGNVTKTTACAEDFGSCFPGASRSDGMYRTTTVSYDPSDFNSPSGAGLVSSLGYTNGRFPVKTTNALGHAEYSAYDALKGVVLQKTGPNGISTCDGYNAFGRQMTETTRCGTAGPLTTTTNEYYTTPGTDPFTSKVVTITQPPTGASTWVYSNDMGTKVDSRGRSFDGGFTQSTTSYDAMGRVFDETRPHIMNVDFPNTTSHEYDELGRPKTLTDPLGDNGAGDLLTAVTTTTYLGSVVRTDKVVEGAVQTRYEKKNVLGKTAWVIDANVNTTNYAYDADGNLTDTTDPSQNVFHTQYDVRGRKLITIDPDLGQWTYVYDGFGELVGQTDPKGQTTSMTYDALGRMTSKTDASGTAEWVFDVAPGAGVGKVASMRSAPDARLSGPCSIPYLNGTTDLRSGRYFTYTSNGDVESESQCVDGDTFITNYEYDAVGRQNLVRYPDVRGTRLAVRYHYTTLGFLQYLTDDADNSVYWKASAMNALGQVTAEQTKNGVSTVSTRNPVGWLLARSSTAQADGNTLIQNWEHQYDEAGNLLFRRRSDQLNAAPSEEFFTYDALNRLHTSQTRILTDEIFDDFEYDALGNLKLKGGLSYTYGGCEAGFRTAGPHAVCSVGGGTPYVYDADGNVTAGAGRAISYNAANKAITIASDVATADFIYGADANRVVQQVTPAGGTPARTVYVGLGPTGKSLYERTTTGSTVEHVQYLYAGSNHGGSAFALKVVTDVSGAVSNATKYYHFDHLGSVTAMSDEMGHVVDASWGGPDAGILGYDAWGARRNPDGHPASPTSFHQQVGRREFTGHETIPSVGLVNMNGRVYDPVLGRFLSPDPNVQFVADLQSYNRYSYVLNNPLAYTDPTGYFISGWFDTAVNVGLALGAVTLCGATSGAGCAIGFAIAQVIYNASSARHAGASWEQIIETNAISMFASAIGAGALNEAAGQIVGRNLAGQLVGATLSGAFGGAVSGVLGGQKHFWSNVVKGAAQGAILSTAAWAIRFAKVSQASAGGPSGAQKLEQGNSFLAVKGSIQEALDLANQMDRYADFESAELLRQLAVENAASALGLSVPEGWSLQYDPTLGGTSGYNGQTLTPDDDPGDPRVSIGNGALRNAGYLGSILIHEFVHVDQYFAGDYSTVGIPGMDNAGALQYARNEITAYQIQLDAASVVGLSPDDIAIVQYKLNFATNNYLYGGDYPYARTDPSVQF
jgi:RHS repeat-associated protein